MALAPSLALSCSDHPLRVVCHGHHKAWYVLELDDLDARCTGERTQFLFFLMIQRFATSVPNDLVSAHLYQLPQPTPDHATSNISADVLIVKPISHDEADGTAAQFVRYRCRKCRRLLATERNMVEVEAGPGPAAFAWRRRDRSAGRAGGGAGVC